MANKVLNEVISGRATWESFVSWLKSNKETPQESASKFDCSQGDFVIYFINLLHDVSSILQKASRGNYSVKKAANFPSHDNIKNNGRKERYTTSPNENYDNCSKQSGFHPAGGNVNKSSYIKSKDDNSVLNKSVENFNKSILRNHTILNGTIKSSVDDQNTSCKVNQNVTNSPIYKAEKSSDVTFLHNCHLSPITTELYSSTKEKYSGFVSEIDSSNNRLIRKDSRSDSSKRMSVERTASSPFNITEHAFPVVGSSTKQNSSRRRRIKPTRLADSFDTGKSTDQNRAPNFGEVVRPVEPGVPFRENTMINEKHETPEADIRDLLRIEKQKLHQNAWNNAMTSKSSQPALIVAVSPETVKHKDELCVLANIYNLLLENNLICNIVTEIHFIFSLLNVQEELDMSYSERKEHVPLKYFVSVNECVFFATAVLNQQRFFLSTLDKASLKLLVNNRRISDFVPDLWKYLCDLHQTRNDIKTSISSSVFHKSVCFQLDTDNRENFPTDKTFITFRKQRDAFYEILGLWEENHRSPGWSFGFALGPRVRSLLCMIDEPANFIHFARLFRTQLLGSCWKSGSAAVEEESSDALADVIRCLKEGNPDKYSRLYERLITPVKSSNSYTTPEFPGQQEFYKDFIVYGYHALFNAHLIDSLWHEIEHLNSSDFIESEVEEGTTVDKDTKQAFVACVENLQLLAKFLGFVLFLPYRTNSNTSEHLVEKQGALRAKLRPPINVLTCVQEAIKTKKLLLTIPWTTQFLSMVDNVSYNLPYYQDVISLLFAIYRMLPSLSFLSPYGSFMLKVCLGWLFERPQLPEDIFYTWCMNGNQISECVLNTENLRSLVAGIDELDLVEWESLKTLCPNLETLKWLLISDIYNVRNEMPPRHITPVLVGAEQMLPSSSARNTELQLEENFLEGQPRSLRKSIEFVSERIASSCVKYICCKPLSEVKERALKNLEASFQSNDKELSVTKMSLETSVLSQELKRNCQIIIPKLCFDKCNGVIPLLLSEDVPDEVTQVCVQIAARLSLEKVNVWINSHITPALFAKHLSSEIDKVSRSTMRTIKSTHVLSNGWRDVPERDAIPPAETILTIRNCICRVIQESEIQEEDILSILSTVLCTLQSRRDLIPSAERVLGALSVDLTFALVAHHPELIKEAILKKFLSIWTSEEVATSNCFQHMICPRNIMILISSSQIKKTWSAAAYFLYFVLKNNVVPPNEFESQCVAVFRQEWSLETLKHMAACFEEVVKLYQRDCCDVTFVLLMELVSDLCREMNNENF